MSSPFNSSVVSTTLSKLNPNNIRYNMNGVNRFMGTVLATTTSTTTAKPISHSFDTFHDFFNGTMYSNSNYNEAYLGNYVIPGDVEDSYGESFNDFLTTPDPISSSATTEGFEGGSDFFGLGDDTSFWDLWDAKYLRHSIGWTITLIVAYVLILIIGIIGNSMVILVVLSRPQMRTVIMNMFIMNLAIADLFVIVFCVPATLLSNVFVPWILGSFMCKGVAYVQGVSVCASAYSLAAISLDRCKAIYRPMERPRGLSKSQALGTICLIWVLALLMTLPWAVVFDVVKSDKDGLLYCIETWRNEEHGKVYFLVANLICCYSLPLILISLSNIVIWCHVSRRKVPQDSASVGTIKRMHRRTRHGVRKMLGIVTLAFLISWLPLYVLVTRMKFSSQESIGETESNILAILIPFAQWLGSWNSSINPVLYAFLNSKFRESFRSLLPSWFPFVKRKPGLISGMATNGTIVGTTGTPSYTTVFTARSSARSQRSGGSSSIGSRRRNRPSQRTLQQQPHVQHQRSLIINQIKAGSTVATMTTSAATITDL